jgi:hypothetical protein
MKDKYGTNYRPRLELVKWADRPAELPDASLVDDVDVWKSGVAAQAAPAAVHVPPPAAKAPARDPALETEF